MLKVAPFVIVDNVHQIGKIHQLSHLKMRATTDSELEENDDENFRYF